MARKKKQPEGPTGAPLFMATYGDMVTLLLTFFVFLYSFSSIDVQKFQKMIFSFQGALGVLPGGKTIQEDAGVYQGKVGQDAGDSIKRTQEFKEGIARQLQALAKEEGLQSQMKVHVDQRGVTVSMSEQFLFAPGSAELSPFARRVLFKVGQVLRVVRFPLSFEGHTDNTPMEGGLYGDNWGLSAARAAAVASYMVNRIGLSDKNVQAVGYGPSKPLVPNDTPEHRAINRRVDIVILTEHSI
ncbi:OmpA/MotB domain protein [Thermanaerovibrio acidaminovorans DSM 6589]|uniref:OmpA/MotB domain protein n=1 Tax=Thermanaerovibrio acidaminovorans (strain ATCC 49978 / DSM 6589 / Su883) TaxID=525903 RepID=D1B6B5_THEAS|nr:flagellar motor protein MotB [Thermanaerovibrio acidaminovorans]ACZ19556.1 OmpA/MotB domain protein [Thermanaerovibrio acidaminovorans DSM 6589]